MATRPDLVVVGGGTIGLASAWRAAQAGLRVTVFDPDPGRGATWAAAGMLAPVTEIHYGELPLLALNLASAEAWPAFAAELGAVTDAPLGYRRCGTLMVARDADDLAALADLHAYQVQAGLGAERLSSRAARELVPRLSPRVRGGIWVPGDHQVDNRALVHALVTACGLAGVELRRARVDAIGVEAGRATGVRLDSGETLGAGRVLLAGGWASATVGGLPPEARPPVRPVKGQLLHLRGPATPPLATCNVRGLAIYLVPRADGRVVAGATVEERGEDITVTAGAVADLLREAIELVPDVAELRLVEPAVGLRPGSPDNAPMLGPSVVDGLVVATGHYRNGVLLTPLTSASVAELLTSGRVPEVIAPFRPDRFTAPATLDRGAR
jgi:glycine oxidase